MDYTLQTPFPVGQSSLICANAHTIDSEGATISINSYLVSSAYSNSDSVQHWMSNFMHATGHICPFCGYSLKQVFRLIQPIPLLVIDLSSKNLYIDHSIEIGIMNSKKLYSLRGVFYYGMNHFTSRFISHEGTIWFHDGMTTNQKMEKEGMLDSKVDLLFCRDMHACGVIYEAL